MFIFSSKENFKIIKYIIKSFLLGYYNVIYIYILNCFNGLPDTPTFLFVIPFLGYL